MKAFAKTTVFRFRNSFTILFGFIFCIFHNHTYSQSNDNYEIKVIEQYLHVYADIKTKTWDGRLNGKVKKLSDNINELRFCCKNFKIDFVKIVSETGKKNIPFYYTDSILVVNFTKHHVPDNTIVFEIGYTAFRFDENLEQQQYEHPGIHPQIWFRHKTVAASAFYPVLLHAELDASFQISIRTKADNKAISNGSLIVNNQVSDNRITYNWQLPSVVTPHRFVFAVGKFHQSNATLKPPDVQSFYSKSLCFVSGEVNQTVKELCDFYSGFFNVSYPYPAFTSVFIEGNNTGTIGTSTCILPDSLILLVNSGQHDVFESCIAYPVAYQYFTTIGSHKSLNEQIFSEILAQYSIYLFLRQKYGSATANAIFFNCQPKENRDSEIFNLTTYQQVLTEMTTHKSRVPLRYMHYLHQYIGDSLFIETLQNYAKRNNSGQHACFHYFTQIINEATSQDCNWFINNFFNNHQEPVIHCKPLSVYGDSVMQIEFVCRNMPSNTSMPVFVDVFTQDSLERKTLWINNGKQVRTIHGKQNIILVRANPEESFPGRINQYFTQKENQVLFRRSNSLMSRIIALQNLFHNKAQVRKQLLSDALNDSLWYIRYTGIMSYKQEQNKFDHNFLLHLQRLAKHDDNYRVRAAAIQRLSKSKVTICLPLFKSILQKEKNPVVIGEILDALYTLDPLSALQLANKCFSDTMLFTKSLHVYCSYAGKQEYDSIVGRYNDCNHFQKFDFLQGFTDYLIRFDQTTIDKGQQFLIHLITSNQSPSLKAEAMKALIALRNFFVSKQFFWMEELKLYAPKSAEAQKIEQRIAYYKKQETIINAKINALILNESDEKMRNKFKILK